MLCYELEEPVIASSLSTTSMYRNLHSDSNQPPSRGFFQPSPLSAGGHSMAQAPSSDAPSYIHSGVSHEYSSQFFVSGINSHAAMDAGSSQQGWGGGSAFSSPTLPSTMSNSWDPMTQQFSSLQSVGPMPPTYPVGGHINPPLASGSRSPISTPGTLSGIECFSGSADHSGAMQLSSMPAGHLSGQRRPYEWINKNAYQNPQAPQGKTRTKDKYRVVYSDHQRLELEKEFRFSRYITIRRKSELAAQLLLSERQVKIWFQNRRAKERKATKKNVDSTLRPNDDHEEDSDSSLHGNELSPGLGANLTSLGDVSDYDRGSRDAGGLQESCGPPHSSSMPYLYPPPPSSGYLQETKPAGSGRASTLADISLPKAASSSAIHSIHEEQEEL